MKISTDVLEVLSAAETNGPHLVLVGQLDRKLYERTNKVLEACGGKWNRGKKAHVFDTDAASRIDQIIVTGEVEIPKDEFNYFPTPAGIVEQMISLAGVNQGNKVLEPSAGRGAIAIPCANLGARVNCYELMAANYDHLCTVNHENIRVEQRDFLTVMQGEVYDKILMNPPFAKQADIRHVMHAMRFLDTHGTLVAIMSAGVKFRQDKLATQFREIIDHRWGSIEDLPEGSFKEYGTMVNTVIVMIPGVKK